MSAVREEKEHTNLLNTLLADCRYLLIEQRPSEALYLAREYLNRGALAPHRLRSAGRKLLEEGSPEIAAVLFEAVLAHIEAHKTEGDPAGEEPAWPLFAADGAPEAKNEEFDSSDLEFVLAEETERRDRRIYEPGLQLVTKTAEADAAVYEQSTELASRSELEEAPGAADWDDTEQVEPKGAAELGDPFDDDDWLEDWGDGDGEFDELIESRTEAATDWDVFVEDVLEFDEAPSREELQVVQTSGRLTKEDRAREEALQMGLANGWDQNEILTLQRIFLSYPWAATRTAVQRLIDQGAGPEELALAHELRMIWRSNPEYAASFGLYAHEVLSWPLAVSIINSFRGYPVPEELEKLLSDLYADWYGSVSCRRNFISFRDYLKARIELSLNDHLCSAGVDWTSDVPETTWELDSATHCGNSTPVMLDLSAFELLPRSRESIFQRVGGIDWNRYDGVAGWASPENYFSRPTKHE